MSHAAILALAPNGAYKQKADHLKLPISLDEIVQTAVDALQSGTSLLHLHIRDKEGQHSLDANSYQRTIDAIRNRVDDALIIQITSEAAGKFSSSQQIASIKAVNPECVSIALREIIPDVAALPAAQALFLHCAERQCRIQYILYSENDLLTYLDYIQRGVIPAAPHSILFVLGRYAPGQSSSPADLKPYLRHVHLINAPWMVCAFGAAEGDCLLHAARKGGHMRIGFENNLLTSAGRLAHDNIEQLQGIIRRTHASGLAIASLAETRRILAIR